MDACCGAEVQSRGTTRRMCRFATFIWKKSLHIGEPVSLSEAPRRRKARERRQRKRAGMSCKEP